LDRLPARSRFGEGTATSNTRIRDCYLGLSD